MIPFLSPAGRTANGMMASGYIDDSRPLDTTAAKATSKRAALVSYACGGSLHALLPTVTADIESPVASLSNLERTDQLDISLVVAMTGIGSVTLNLRGYHWVPTSSVKNKAVLFCGGHADTMDDDKTASPSNLGYGDWRMISTLVAAGFDVFGYYMPEFGPTTQSYTHDQVMTLISDSASGNALRVFLHLPIAIVNYAVSLGTFTAYDICGLSGGGWTALLMHGLDTRISKSYSVFGSLPSYMRTTGNRGDAEQTSLALYSQVGFLDLYALAANNGKHVQIWGANDGVFGEVNYDATVHPRLRGKSWDDAVDDIDAEMQTTMTAIGTGTFAKRLDTTADPEGGTSGHQITWDSANYVAGDL